MLVETRLCTEFFLFLCLAQIRRVVANPLPLPLTEYFFLISLPGADNEDSDTPVATST
jgi:hypothetical protein